MIFQRGLRYTAHLALQRVFPATWVSWGYFDVFHLIRPQNRKELPPGFQIVKLPDTPSCKGKREELAEVTHASVSAQSGSVGHAIMGPNGHCVGGGWTTTAVYREVSLGLELQENPDSIWVFSTRIDNDFRRQGLYSALLSALSEEHPQMILAIHPYNRRSRLAHRRFIKADRIGRIFAFRCFGRLGVSVHGDAKTERSKQDESIRCVLLGFTDEQAGKVND